MENLNEFYKLCALNNAKKSPTVQVLEEERKENVNKQINYMEKNLQTKYPGQDELVDKLLKQEIGKIDFGSPIIDITNTSNVKTLEEFINESIEKDRQVAIEIGESLKELIQTAPEEDVKEIEGDLEDNQSIEEFARQSVEEEVQETYEIPNPDEILEQEEQAEKDDGDKKGYIEPKYFVIDVGNEDKQKQIIVDIDGNEVGKIEDGQFEMDDDYFNSQLEKYNIDDFISVKVKNFEELQRVRQEIKPKSIEQLAEMNFESGKEILDKTNEVIEEIQNDDIPKEEEKPVLDKTDEDNLEVDEEYEKNNEGLEELDELTKDGKSDKVQNYLDQNSSRKLTILIPYTLTDQLSNHEFKDRGEEITVYQLKGTVKPVFVLQQGERILYGGKYNEQIQKNMSKVPYTSGVVREVSDEETTAEVKLIDGTEKEFLVKGHERDLNESQKEVVIAKIEELSDELNRILNVTADDVIDFKIEFPGGMQEKCNRIDYLEMEIYKTCSQYGIVPPVEIKSSAMDKTEVDELAPEDQVQEDDSSEVRTAWGDAENNRWGSSS